jgi:hypothetical protein
MLCNPNAYDFFPHSPATHRATQKTINSDESKVRYDRSTYEDFEASNRTLRTHVPKAKIQGHHDKTIKEKSSAKKIKLDNTEETFSWIMRNLMTLRVMKTFVDIKISLKNLVEKKGRKSRSTTNVLTLH